MKISIGCLVILLLSHSIYSQQISRELNSPKTDNWKPSILVVNAHPDDEIGCAATVYTIAKELHGTVDLCLITNGEAGFKYSTLAEPWYGLELTDEEVGRQNLPRIRKIEMLKAGDVLGIRNCIFLEHLDHKYTQNADSVLRYVWDTTLVKLQLHAILKRNMYDAVFVLLPTTDTHGAHKSATILTLNTLAEMPIGKRPIIAGVGIAPKDSAYTPSIIDKDYPITALSKDIPFIFDRTRTFGYNNRLSYKIIAQWLVAEHKSQGTVQLGVQNMDKEYFWLFAMNPLSAQATMTKLFSLISQNRYSKKVYK